MGLLCLARGKRGAVLLVAPCNQLAGDVMAELRDDGLGSCAAAGGSEASHADAWRRLGSLEATRGSTRERHMAERGRETELGSWAFGCWALFWTFGLGFLLFQEYHFFLISSTKLSFFFIQFFMQKYNINSCKIN